MMRRLTAIIRIVILFLIILSSFNTYNVFAASLKIDSSVTYTPMRPLDTTAPQDIAQQYANSIVNLRPLQNFEALPPNVPITVMHESDSLWGNEVLAELKTNENGEIHSSVIYRPDIEEFNLYFVIKMEISLGSRRAGVYASDLSPFPIEYKTPTIYGVSNVTYSDTINIPITDDYMNGSANILKVIKQTEDWMKNQLDNWSSVGSVVVQRNNKDTHQAFILGGGFYIGNPSMWVPEVITHEYSHIIMDDKITFFRAYTVGHDYEVETNVTCAFSEGWAEFMESAVHNNIEFPLGGFWDDNQPIPSTKETNTFWRGRGGGDDNSGEIVEGAVASVFWDIYDPPNDDDIDSDFKGLWNALVIGKHNTFNGFWREYMSLTPHKQDFREICEKNGIVYTRGKIEKIKIGDEKEKPLEEKDLVPQKFKLKVGTLTEKELHLSMFDITEWTTGAIIQCRKVPETGIETERNWDVLDWKTIGTITKDDWYKLNKIVECDTSRIKEESNGEEYQMAIRVVDRYGTMDTLMPVGPDTGALEMLPHWHNLKTIITVKIDNILPKVETITLGEKEYPAVQDQKEIPKDIPLDSEISAIFSEEMDNQDNILLKYIKVEGPDGEIQGQVNYDKDSKKLTFKPSDLLKEDSKYTITISGKAKDLAGNFLDGNKFPENSKDNANGQDHYIFASLICNSSNPFRIS